MTTSTRRIWAGLRGGLAKTLATAVVLLGTCSLAVAQGGAEGTTPPFLKPGLPAGTYPLSGFDSVNLFNGNLNFHLPLMDVAGRGGARIPVMKKIEARWRVVTDVPCSPCSPAFYPTYNWWTGYTVGYGPGTMEGRPSTFGTKFCTFGEEIPDKSLLRLTFTTSDGTEYELRDQLTDGAPQPIPDYPNCPNYPWFDRGTVFVTADGSSATFFSCAPDGTPIPLHDSDPVIPSGFLLVRDGTRYRIDGSLVTWMQDRNGNRITFFYEHTDWQGNPDGRVTRIIDSLNRQVTISYDVPAGAPFGTCDEISFQGFGEDNRKVRVSKDLMSNVLRSGFVIRTYHDLFPNFSGSSYTPFDESVTSAVWLPDGRSYKFYYNDYGELSRVVLPTGGAVEYDWGEGMINALTGGYTGRGGIYRRVLERRVYPNGASGVSFASKETYSVPETYVNGDLGPPPNVGYVVVKQFDSNLNLLTASNHYFNGSAVYNPNEDNNGVGFYWPWNNGKEYKTEALDTDGSTVLQRVEHTFDQTAPPWWNPSGCTECIPPTNNPRITQTLTTWVQTNQVAKQSYSYDQYNNKTVIQEFDYGTGSPPANPKRRTEIDYVIIGETNEIDYTGSSIATNVNTLPYLRSLPKEQRVYAVSATGSTTLAAQTHFYYDAAALMARPSITGWQSPVTTARGNLTSTTRWLNTGGSITTSMLYDIAGNAVSVTDARNNSTSFDFSDRFGTPDDDSRLNDQNPVELTGGLHTYAFTTKITNAMTHELYIQFDYYVGKPINSEDTNGMVTSVSYDDSLDRPTEVILGRVTGDPTSPQRRRTRYTYNDTSRLITTESDQTALQDAALKTEILYDGLGRPVDSRQYAPEGVIHATQSFDAIGRVSQTPNPYIATSEATYGTTVTSYDALGRVKRVETFNGSGASTGAVTTDYSESRVLVTDQAGKQRISKTDGLGRLTDVWEIRSADTVTGTEPVTFPNHPEVAAGYRTKYSYDALDDLTQVKQQIGTTGTTQTRTFVYDGLKRLTSAFNPESGSVSYTYDENSNLKTKLDARSITTTYAYDTLNRVTSRTYTNDPQNTPAVAYKYDGQSLPTNAPGTSLFDRGFSTGRLVAVTYGGTSAGNYTGYDRLGRANVSVQQSDSQNYRFTYEYDLASEMTSEVYPSGRTIANAYDVAGRLTSVDGQKTGESNKTYASQFSYAAHGAVAAMQLGNGKWEHTTFNSRLQPIQIGLGTSATDSSLLMLDYGYGPTSNNNGNVITQKITAPGLTLNQCYGYDSLNRLATAEERSGSNCTGTLQWKQAFSYDRYANRNFDVANTTANVLGPNPTISQTTNRFTSGQSYGYDGAGNLTSEPATSANGIVYDAENRQTQYTKTQQATNFYSYDGDGHRVKKIDSSGTTVFVYNVGGQLIAEYTSGPPTGSGTSYLTSDHLGSTRVVMKPDGSVARHDCLPFGEEISSTIGGRGSVAGYGALDSTRQRFTQKERDNESGLDYFLARYYSSAQGRFTSVDPHNPILDSEGKKEFTRYLSEPRNWNHYVYCWNNPLKFVDPTGQLSVPIAGLAAAVAEEEQRRQQQQRAVLIVGDAGLLDHNVGNNFVRAAETRAGELRQAGYTVNIERASTVGEFNEALTTNGTIDRVEYFGHGRSDMLFVGQGSGAETNIDASNISELDNRNLSPGATAVLNSCNSALGGEQSIGARMANELQRPTTGYDTTLSFSSNRNVHPGTRRHPSSGSTYMVPDRRDRAGRPDYRRSEITLRPGR
ncbi:MAG: RHS repeat-associated core domain-containing protein [Acidobacteriota bacterium]